MPKNKRPAPRKSALPVVEDDDLQAQALADLALAIAEHEDPDPAALRQQEGEFARLLRNALRKNHDAVLYGAIERARDADLDACQYLRSQLEEASATAILRRAGAPAMEINAFLVPLFVRGTGGLKQEETFQDGPAFEQLVASIQQAGLESAAARVVLISHAYDLDAIDRISYCHLHEMVRDAAASMSEKKLVAAPALERSIVGWAPNAFAAGDAAMELRFLLGFALKRADDPFYLVPGGEDEADAYFAARMERYRLWTVQAAPLVRRCLCADPAAIEVSFLYQDLFFGAKEQAMAELAMLGMLSAVHQAIDAQRLEASQVQAIVGPAEVGGALVLRVNLYAAEGGALLDSADLPLELAADLPARVDDIADALGSIGVREVSVALRFGPDGGAVGARRHA